MAKRLLALVLAALALAALSPLLLVIAIVVRLDSAGPVLFRQTRVGRAERPFQILKFRTMRPSSEGRLITVDGDSRITRVGAILRKTKLDELPQLINVLTGTMSLVGPRPEVPRYVALYPAHARRLVLSVRPGITDNAAVEFRNESELLSRSADPERAYIEEILPRKLALYESYVRNRSFLGDLRIIVRTIHAVIRT